MASGDRADAAMKAPNAGPGHGVALRVAVSRENTLALVIPADAMWKSASIPPASSRRFLM
jgi:hypothetical protein